MNWRLWTWKDVTAFVLVIAAMLGLLLYVIPYRPRDWNFGFGPEWNCRQVSKGDPVCTKKPTQNPP